MSGRTGRQQHSKGTAKKKPPEIPLEPIELPRNLELIALGFDLTLSRLFSRL
jgi:hypothetical protein